MNKVTVEDIVSASIQKVWEYWNNPEHIKQWAFASDTWECLYAENDIKTGGKFMTRMSAKDHSATFDIHGVYTRVVPFEHVDYTMEDGRTVSIKFEKINETTTKIVEEFEIENQNPEEMQRAGWQAILENFKKYVESSD